MALTMVTRGSVSQITLKRFCFCWLLFVALIMEFSSVQTLDLKDLCIGTDPFQWGLSDEISEYVMDANPLFLKGINDGCIDSTAHGHHAGGRIKASTIFNVRSAGAVGDGVTNDTAAFNSAWKSACAVANGEVYVPPGYTFLVYPSTYSGACQPTTIFNVGGTILAPQAISAWDGLNVRHWLVFQNLDQFYLQGGGTFNGRGENWWACKESNACSEAPTAVMVSKSSHVTVKDVHFVNSQQIHLWFNTVTTGHANNVTITAPASSPNTDGIHVSATTDFSIQNCHVTTGDDCISIVSGSHNIEVQNTYCGEGCHGISVGSLGYNGEHANVTQVQVVNCTMQSTTNGLRVKSWQGGSGIASNFDYENIHMTNVSNPIILDQFYCPSSQVNGTCSNSFDRLRFEVLGPEKHLSGKTGTKQQKTSAVHFDQIKFVNITGTSASSTAVKFACSDAQACTNIQLANIHLVTTSGAATESSCSNAYGTATGTEEPPSCLK